jgi:hypothetical protein
MIGKTIAHYHIIEQLGAGGMVCYLQSQGHTAQTQHCSQN